MEYNSMYGMDGFIPPEFREVAPVREGRRHAEFLANIIKLATFGPALARPSVDTLKGSAIKNLKELRVQYDGDPYRLLFVFDPKRRAVLLVGGSKRGANQKQW